MSPKKMQAIIYILVILIAMTYIFFLSPISPYAPAPIGSVVGERVRLPGFMGFLGFYRHPYDNRHTLYLLALFALMGLGRIVSLNFLKPKDKKS